MRRIIFSIVFGLIFPLVCFFTIMTADSYFLPPSILTTSRIDGEVAPGILYAPFSIPIYVEIILKHNGIMIMGRGENRFIYFTVFLIIFNWILYGVIFYALSVYLTKLKKPKTEYSEKPPEPPIFEKK